MPSLKAILTTAAIAVLGVWVWNKYLAPMTGLPTA